MLQSWMAGRLLSGALSSDDFNFLGVRVAAFSMSLDTCRVFCTWLTAASSTKLLAESLCRKNSIVWQWNTQFGLSLKLALKPDALPGDLWKALLLSVNKVWLEKITACFYLLVAGSCRSKKCFLFLNCAYIWDKLHLCIFSILTNPHASCAKGLFKWLGWPCY